MYEIILKRRDNFITAAINADDPKMKVFWLKLAQNMNSLLRLYSNYSIQEFQK